MTFLCSSLKGGSGHSWLGQSFSIDPSEPIDIPSVGLGCIVDTERSEGKLAPSCLDLEVRETLHIL